MNCCDYECNDGPNCPIHGANKVARIGRKDYDREPLPPTVWREYTRSTAKFFLLGLLGWFFYGLIFFAFIVN